MELFSDFTFEPRPHAPSLPTAPLQSEAQAAATCDQPLPAAVERRLVEQAVLIRELAPWEKVRENHPIGLRDPETGQLGIISILGRGAEMYAVHYFHPPYAVPFWQHATGSSEERPSSITITSCEFFTKDKADAADLARMGKYRKISRKRNGVPALRSYRPGQVSDRLYRAEGEALMLVFDLIALYMEKTPPKRHRELYQWEKEAGATHMIPVLRLKSGGSAQYLADWEICSEPLA